MFRNTAIFFFLFSLSQFGYAQEFGGFKPSKVWSQLKNDNYRIIYSKENEITARKIAGIIDQINQFKPNIGSKRRKINLILQNSTTQANGYVGLAPFVSEFFLTPFPSSFGVGSLPWPYTLGVHEYQHVLQYSNSNYGLSKLGYFLGGEATWSALQAISIPNWFFEGDAVRAETEYTEQGRGRIPTFFNGYRAFAQENKIPSYAKVRNSSFKDFVPNHYPLGYLMIRYGREKYGDSFWSKVLKDAAAYKGVIYPFSRALKRNGAEHSNKFYNNMMNNLSLQLKRPTNPFGRNLFEVKDNRVVDNAFPKFDNDSSLYFIQSSYDEIAQIYQLKNGKVIAHAQPGLRSENYFDVQDGKLVFTQTYYDKRWGWIDYQDVVTYNTTTQKQLKLTSKGKYFHPSFSPDGSKIAVLKVQPNHQFFLVILDATTGKEIQEINNPENLYYTYPTWMNEREIVSAARDSIGQMFLARVDLTNERIQKTEASYHLIGRPSIREGKIYYTASYSGIDNVYSYQNGEIQQLTQGGLGRYSPVINPTGDSIYFTEFSLNGHQLKAAPIKALEFSPKALKELDFYNQAFKKDAPVLSTSLSNDTISAKPYSKFGKLINIHSWGLRFNDPEYGIELNSENVLNTLDLTAAYFYNSNEKGSGYELEADYGQYFLHFNTALRNSQRSIARSNSPNIPFTETESSIGVSLPLNYSSNLFTRSLRLSSSYDFIMANFKNEAFKDQQIHSSNVQLLYQQKRLKARKNIFTHLGIYSRIRERRVFNETANQLLIQNSFAFRGLFQNHNIVVDADAQLDNGSKNYRFSDLFVYARGFQSIRFSNLYKTGINYHFPIIYPDKGFLGITYLKRLRGNVFFDYSLAAEAEREFNSLGAELIFDLEWLNAFSIPMGVRYSHILSQQAFSSNGSPAYIELFLPFSRF